MEKQKTSGALVRRPPFGGGIRWAKNATNDSASAGHKLGQLVGDWFEEYFVLPLLVEVAAKLRLYLDHRFHARQARSDKILWKDEEENTVDYDFVMELAGSDEAIGIPVAFFECFWRRGSRHSKDKARDDSGKLMPMTLVHPTARFLGIIAAGDFTQPRANWFCCAASTCSTFPRIKSSSRFPPWGWIWTIPTGLPKKRKIF